MTWQSIVVQNDVSRNCMHSNAGLITSATFGRCQKNVICLYFSSILVKSKDCFTFSLSLCALKQIISSE